MSPLTIKVAMTLKPIVTQLSRRRIPQTSGRIYLPDIHETVTIGRDKWGIPHISAYTRHDLLFAQGFVHAQDRLWQMELNRLAAKGELSALFGSMTIKIDRITRTLGFGRLARENWKSLGGEVREDLTAYAEGVNAFLHSCRALPIEFSLLRHRPEPWQPSDSIAYGRLHMWALTHGAMGEIVQAKLINLLGEEKAKPLLLHYPEDHPITLPQGIEVNDNTIGQMVGAPFAPFLGKGSADGVGRGSNAWVISPRLSATGQAILCNDVHLPVGVPSLWHFQHLRSNDGFYVTGFSLPGTPYVLVGHNEHIAWGATLSYVDCEDLFAERAQAANPIRFQVGEEWKEAQVVEERIPVRWGKTCIERVIFSRNGPIISGVMLDSDQVVALRSTALNAGVAFDGFALLNTAANWDEFVHAVSRIEAPSLNLLYADVSGNIGHYVTGKAPIRAKGDGASPVPGWNDEYAWIGTIPFSEMPHALNPKEGFIVSANNRLIDSSFPHYLGRVWRSGYRARRLRELITSRTKISLEDCRRFQLDLGCGAGLDLVRCLEDLIVSDQDARLSLHLLRQWDGMLSAESVGGSVYQVFLRRLAHRILSSQLDETLTHQLLGKGPEPLLAPVNEFQGSWPAILARLLSQEDSVWLPDRQSVLELSLAESTVELRKLLGENPQRWSWGRLHKIRFAHALGRQPALGAIFGLGPWPVGGDATTVAQTSILPDLPYENIAVSVSTRQIVDLGNLDKSVAMMVPGQSGHLGSTHYDDMVRPWLNGEYFSMEWTDPEPSKTTGSRLSLVPSARMS